MRRSGRGELAGLEPLRDGAFRLLGSRVTPSGARLDVRAANVVNATGVWADELRPQELHDEAELPRIRPSRGQRHDGHGEK